MGCAGRVSTAFRARLEGIAEGSAVMLFAHVVCTHTFLIRVLIVISLTN